MLYTKLTVHVKFKIYQFTQIIVLTLKLCVFTNTCRQQTSIRHGLPITAVENFRFMWWMKVFIHSFHWHMQNAMIPWRSQELLPFLSVIYFFLSAFTNYSSILSHLILPSISWSTFQSCCSQILFLSILCTCTLTW